jgi:hypothetical protein
LQGTLSAEQFAELYNALCEISGFQITVTPQYVPERDGSWSTILQTGISPLARPPAGPEAIETFIARVRGLLLAPHD